MHFVVQYLSHTVSVVQILMSKTRYKTALRPSLSGAQSAFYSAVTKGTFPRDKVTGECKWPITSINKDKNEWSHTYTPPTPQFTFKAYTGTSLRDIPCKPIHNFIA